MNNEKHNAVADQNRFAQTRLNAPPASLVGANNNPDTGEPVRYEYDIHEGPSLQWASKKERTSFEVPTVSLHVHERIDPHKVLLSARQDDEQQQLNLFEPRRSLSQAMQFYKHQDNWSNRLIAGDSLLVMNSLLQKEAMGGKVQMIYFDPPYGIKYGSNFQPYTNKHDVQDGKDSHLSTEPEMLKAFRDTWEMGIHSYLNYIRDRLLLAKELLADSGSIFLQIGDENVHRVGMLMDEVFGAENRVATISFATTGSSSSRTLPSITNYLLLYAKDKNSMKYQQLYEKVDRSEIISFFNWDAMVELKDGTCRKPTKEESKDPDTYLPEGSRLYKRSSLNSQGLSTSGRSEPFVWKGRTYTCGKNRHWSISFEGLKKMGELGRLHTDDNYSTLGWKRYEDEVPGRRINNIWSSLMRANSKHYVVQTAKSTIQRCILMTTEPGDLVLDITCGSGTTACVAEQWGRRWITCDTSRIALAIAKQRLLTTQFDYYQLAYPNEGVSSGFVYKTVNKVSPSTLGYDQPPIVETLYDQPIINSKRTRITSPFTVEAVPAPVVKSVDELSQIPIPDDTSQSHSGETLRQTEWRQELLKTGVRAKNGNKITFARVELFKGASFIQAEAETDEATPKRVLVVFGPEYAPMTRTMVEHACLDVRNLNCDILLFCAFQFDNEAAREIDKIPTEAFGFEVLKAVMNPDLNTKDLRKQQSSNESFWLVGQPDVQVVKNPDGTYQVEVRGFDYYNPNKGAIESGGSNQIAMWLLDTNYNNQFLLPQQIFFPMANTKDGWAKLAKTFRAKIDTSKMEAFRGTQSLPFRVGQEGKIAVKIVDDRGIESLRVFDTRTLAA